MEDELKVQEDRPISPGSRVRSGYGRELIFQTPDQPFHIASKISGGTTHSAAGQQVYNPAKRATPPVGSASEGPPNALKNEKGADGAQSDVAKHTSRSKHASVSLLPEKLPSEHVTAYAQPTMHAQIRNAEKMSATLPAHNRYISNEIYLSSPSADDDDANGTTGSTTTRATSEETEPPNQELPTQNRQSWIIPYGPDE
ncbi:hypothetical protein MY8738_006404 [Beauveria namnaoensis]